MEYRQTIVNGITTIVDFDHAGDTFPVHSHTEQDNHTTAVVRGSFEDVCTGEKYRAGDVIVWEANVPHGFRALEDRTKLVNSRMKG